MEQSQRSGLHASDHVEVLKRRWLTAAVVFTMVCSAVAYATWRRAPVYEATTKVTFRPRSAGAVLSERESPSGRVRFHDVSFATQIHLLATDDVIHRIAEHLELLVPDMDPERESQAIDQVREALLVDRISDTSILRIRARHPNPKMAARIANATATTFAELTHERSIREARQVASWLTATLVDISEKLEEAERASMEFARRKDLSLDAVELGRSRAELSEEAGRIEALKATLETKRAELQPLRLRYRAAHPKVSALLTEIASLEQQLENERRGFYAATPSRVEFGSLRRAAEVHQDLRDLLVRRLAESHVAYSRPEATVEVIQAARIPDAPVRPQRIRDLALGGGLSVFLGLAFAFLAEYMDRSLKRPDEVERALGLPILSVVHRVRKSKRASPLPLLFESEGGASREVEVFRTLRTNLKFCYRGEERRLLLVASAAPGEGKTTVAVNLALATARTGQRVLLVDADFRHAELHRPFNLKPRGGLADVLSGAAELDQTIVRAHSEVDLLPSGSMPRNPCELLDSRRMRELLATLRERYECVILDSPPIGIIADASVLASQVEGVVLVVEAGRFPAAHFERLKHQIERAGGKIYGVVLNKLSSSESTYGAYYYYYSEHEQSALPELSAARG